VWLRILTQKLHSGCIAPCSLPPPMVDITEPTLPEASSAQNRIGTSHSVLSRPSPSAHNASAENTPSLPPPQDASPDRDVDPQEPSNANAEAPDSECSLPSDTKKTYLSLLPQEQIIEICLLFETHVPPNIRTSVWPTDLEAAINDLKKKAASQEQSKQPPSHPQPNGQTVLPLTNGASHPSTSNTPP